MDWNKEHLIMMKCIDSVDAQIYSERDSELPLWSHKNSFDCPARDGVWIFHGKSKL